MKAFDILGLGHKVFPWQMVLDELPNKCGIGIFDVGVFTESEKVIEKRVRAYLDSGTVKLIRVQGFWHDGHAKLIPIKFMRKRLCFWNNLAEEYSSIAFYYSHTCEHTGNAKQVKKRMRIINEYKNLIVVNSPMGKGFHMPGKNINETHGDAAPLNKPYIVSMDGTDATEINIKKWRAQHKEALFQFLWIHSFNLRKKGAPFVPIKDRKIRVTREEMRWLKKQ